MFEYYESIQILHAFRNNSCPQKWPTKILEKLEPRLLISKLIGLTTRTKGFRKNRLEIPVRLEQ